MKKRKRPELRPSPILRFDSGLVERFHESEREKGLGLLHFSARPSNVFDTAGVYRLGQLVDIASIGILAGNLGAKAIAESRQALRCLVAARGHDGRVDWLKYAVDREFLILPNMECAGFPGARLLRLLPSVCVAAARSLGGRLDALLFERSVLNQIPNRILGPMVNLSHQAIALRNERVLRIVRGALMEGEYRCCRFYFREDLVSPLRKAGACLRSKGKRAIAHKEWKEIVNEAWQVDDVSDPQVENLLLAILGYRLVQPSPPQKEPIVIPKGQAVEPLRRMFARAARLMKKEFRRGVSQKELRDELRSPERRGISVRAEIPLLVNAVFPVTEAAPGGGIRPRIADVKWMTDQLERILLRKGVPTHFQELAKELNRHNEKRGLVRSGHQVSAALSSSRRFRPIVRSGLWALTEWKEVEMRSIVDVAADILHRESRPLTETELFQGISASRSVSYDSIGSLLAKDARFLRTRPREWILK